MKSFVNIIGYNNRVKNNFKVKNNKFVTLKNFKKKKNNFMIKGVSENEYNHKGYATFNDSHILKTNTF